eukprot:CAMPEP_0168513922 /NCGR_PEP_ID=MMETSP0405-20121227/3776_1 /TAXON_ID=498012 /ORGANISM="Trichosphaerium sp, Strain Am-I-7 wt" /LENGTH=212 /DNA_ID=CAMNT_0008532897 /DNA_START=35 /DNA_END=670 /DNA_ORIENTATION=-
MSKTRALNLARVASQPIAQYDPGTMSISAAIELNTSLGTTTAITDDTQRDSYYTFLCVKIHSGSKLVVSDLFGCADPYAKVGLVHYYAKDKPIKKPFLKTKVIKKNINPKWREKANTEYNDEKFIKFEVWDDDFMIDDFMGEAYIDIQDMLKKNEDSIPIADNTIHKDQVLAMALAQAPEIALTLQSRYRKKDKVSGTIIVAVAFTRIKKNT